MHLLLYHAPSCARVYAAMTLEPQALLLGQARGCRSELRAASSGTGLSRAPANQQAMLTSFDVNLCGPCLLSNPSNWGVYSAISLPCSSHHNAATLVQ